MTTRTIELTAIDLEKERHYRDALGQHPANDDGGDEEFADTPPGQVPATSEPVTELEGLYFPVTIVWSEENIREFYPRKHGLSGTRIVYQNGAARPVKETYAEVKAAVASLNN